MQERNAPASTLSEVQRLIGIFWEPRPVFEDLTVRPRFWVPLLLLTLLSVFYIASFTKIVGWEAYIERQIERQLESSPRLAQLTPEQREQAIAASSAVAKYMGIGGAVAGFPLMCLLVAGVLTFVFNALASAQLRFRHVFSITCYSFLPTALASLLALLILFLKNPEDFDLENPLPTNLAAFLPSSPRWVLSLAQSVDLFTVWVILLLALGLSTASRKISFGKSLTLVLSPYVVYAVLKAALTALSS